MSRRPEQDAPLFIALVAGLAVLAAVLHHSSLPGGLIARAELPLEYGLSALVVLTLAGLTCRVVVTRRTLARRVRLVVLAPDSFAPTLDAVLRFAAQLSRVRRFTGGWFDPGASAVRVLLDGSREGAMRYSLVVPERLPAGGPLGAEQLRPGTGPPRAGRATAAGGRVCAARRAAPCPVQ